MEVNWGYSSKKVSLWLKAVVAVHFASTDFYKCLSHAGSKMPSYTRIYFVFCMNTVSVYLTFFFIIFLYTLK